MNMQTDIKAKLALAGIGPTKQRLALAELIFREHDRHFNADELFTESVRAGCGVSLATIYNTLKTFCDTGLLREVVVDATRTYYDTNASRHHHFYAAETGTLIDIAGQGVVLAKLPAAPEGMTITDYEVMIHVTRK
jgi:Fur family transcriptional regulator, iron response regulator